MYVSEKAILLKNDCIIKKTDKRVPRSNYTIRNQFELCMDTQPPLNFCELL